MEIKVAVSPRFDLCYALADLVSARPRLRIEIARGAAGTWLGAARRLGSAYWLAVPDLLGAEPPSTSFDELFRSLAAVPHGVVKERLAEGLFHDPSVEAARTAAKREWLAHIGLDAGGANAAATRAALAREPGELLSATLEILEGFRATFEPIWNDQLAALQASARSVVEHAGRTDFSGIASQLNLKVEVRGGRLRALRGGYEIPVTDVGNAYLLPSLVNVHGYWTGADGDVPATIFFPFVDPRGPSLESAKAAIDPWLMCRALGEPTRAAIVRLLGVAPMTSAELMRELDLSKANISHHIFQLREAGLIDEKAEGRSVRLYLRREALGGLSAAFRRVLPAGGRQPRGRDKQR